MPSSLWSDLWTRSIGIFTSKFDPDTDIPDLSGKVALVTGGNSGIGFYTVRELARKGAKVYMGSRDETRGKAALARLYKEGGLGKGCVELLKLDLSTPQSVRCATIELLGRTSRLDIIINNAAVLQEYYQTVYQGGIELSHSMATNHLGHFVLVRELLPLLTLTSSGGDVRIITVASEAHWFTPVHLNFRTVGGWNFPYDWALARTERYGLTKLANVLFSGELQRQLSAGPDTSGITAIAVHPGGVASEGGLRLVSEQAPFLVGLWLWLIGLFALSPRQGAFTSLFAATSPKVTERPDLYKGAYLYPYNRVGRASWRGRDRKLAADLWAASEEITLACFGDAPQVHI